jgi:FkbH-like protein
MSNRLFASLSWLPQPAEDFTARCKALLEAKTDAGRNVRALATYALDQNQLARLAGTIDKLRAASADLSPLTPFCLGLLSNSTTDFIAPALIATASRHGVALEVIKGGYDQVLQDALTPDSSVNRAAPDAVLIAIDYRGLPIRGALGNADKGREAVNAALGFLQAVRDGIKRNSKAICIFQTISAPPETLFGNMDGVHPGALRRIIDAINAGIAESVQGTPDIVVDVAHLASTVGLADWHAPRDWNSAKLPFSESFVPLYAEHVTRAIAALRGKSRRCLILDLDNTLWGGVIGDDGLEGIKLGQGDATGEAYLSVQRLALDLRSRGIVLAVCSKNEDEIARSAFQRHPDMLLKENHIAVFQANWKDKATNIKAIAAELSLGLESLVFLDDNPVERLLIRQMLPEVAVPELPDDPSLYARTLAAAGYFEAVTFSEDDLKRADFYQDNARRVNLQKQAGDLESYLASLDMEITFQSFDETGRARISQLINKSNQFNVTTKRYTEAQVEAMQNDPAYFTLQVRLSDTFGDNGMISVVICRRVSPDTWEIDTWLMSCRVLGRRVEDMVLREILEHAKAEGVKKIIGIYIPTDRNKLVAEHYPKLGFHLIRKEGNTSTYELDVDTASVASAPMRVKRIAAEPSSAGSSARREPAQPTVAAPAVMAPASAVAANGNGATPSVATAKSSSGIEAAEAKLIPIWEEVLDREGIRPEDDFFELGGDSILAIRLMIEIEKQFQKRFEISKLASHPTLRALAGELVGPSSAASPDSSNPSESQLRKIWEDILDRENIAPTDNFFDLGGDSILAIRMMIEIEKQFGKRYEISVLASHPTLEALAAEIAGRKPETGATTGEPASLIVPMRPQGDATPLFCVHCGTGHVLRYRHLVSLLDTDTPVYGIRAPELRDMKASPTVESLAERYVSEIRKVQPHGPYQLFGFCFGGVVALEIARQFREIGEEVELITMVQSINVAHYQKLSFPDSMKYRFLHLKGRAAKYGGRLVRGELGEIYLGLRNLADWEKRKNRWKDSNADAQDGVVSTRDVVAYLTTVAESYVPKPYPGRVNLIRANDLAPEIRNDKALGWQNVASGGIEVCDLPGDHFSILEKPFVDEVARTLKSWLSRTEVNV